MWVYQSIIQQNLNIGELETLENWKHWRIENSLESRMTILNCEYHSIIQQNLNTEKNIGELVTLENWKHWRILWRVG